MRVRAFTGVSAVTSPALLLSGSCRKVGCMDRQAGAVPLRVDVIAVLGVLLTHIWTSKLN